MMVLHAVGGGAIFTLNNTILSFDGTTNFINNLANHVQSTHQIIQYLASAEPIISSTSQQLVVVVQLQLTIILYLASMEPPALSITQHLWVELS